MTGEAAVQQAVEVKPEVVLMDIRLRGDMSGLEAARRIHEVHPVPVVYITAHASTLASTTGTQPPPFVIAKPFTLAQIESVIQDASSAL